MLIIAGPRGPVVGAGAVEAEPPGRQVADVQVTVGSPLRSLLDRERATRPGRRLVLSAAVVPGSTDRGQRTMTHLEARWRAQAIARLWRYVRIWAGQASCETTANIFTCPPHNSICRTELGPSSGTTALVTVIPGP